MTVLTQNMWYEYPYNGQDKAFPSILVQIPLQWWARHSLAYWWSSMPTHRYCHHHHGHHQLIPHNIHACIVEEQLVTGNLGNSSVVVMWCPV